VPSSRGWRITAYDLGIFFIFSPNLKQSSFENIFKTRPFGPTTMHGGANAQNPAMHGGGVLLLTWHGSGDTTDVVNTCRDT